MKIHLCDSCQFYSHDPHLVCAIHPDGVDGNNCLDYRKREDFLKEENGGAIRSCILGVVSQK
jgi:hypothetical protein